MNDEQNALKKLDLANQEMDRNTIQSALKEYQKVQISTTEDLPDAVKKVFNSYCSLVVCVYVCVCMRAPESRRRAAPLRKF